MVYGWLKRRMLRIKYCNLVIHFKMRSLQKLQISVKKIIWRNWLVSWITIKIVLWFFKAVKRESLVNDYILCMKNKTAFFQTQFHVSKRKKSPTPILIDWFRYDASNVSSITILFMVDFSHFAAIVILHRLCIMNFYLENNKQFIAYYFQCTKYWLLTCYRCDDAETDSWHPHWLSIRWAPWEFSLVVKFYNLTLQ